MSGVGARMAYWTGLASVFIWMTDGLVIAASTVIEPATWRFNVGFSIPFFLIAALFFWRARVVKRLGSVVPDAREMRAFVRTEIVTCLVACLFGLLVFTGIASRALVEQVPVFG